MKEEQKNTWVLKRHRIIMDILRPVVGTYAKWKYGVDVKKYREEKERQMLILLNHQTPFDQFFVGMAFSQPIYYLATEDIFSKGWISSLIRFLVAPIPIKKQTMDLKAIKNCLLVAKEGGSICLAPEGNRSYSGKTEYMNPSIVKLAKKLKLPVAIFRIEGGYGVQPRWSDVVRRGHMKAYVSEVIEPEEYEKLSNDEFFNRIEEGLYVNEAVADGEFWHKNRAEYLERAIYYCPYCGLSKFYSEGHTVRCTTCGKEIEYTPNKELKGIGFDFPYPFVNDWYEAQKEFVNALDTNGYLETPLFRDEVTVSQVFASRKKEIVYKTAAMNLFGDRVEILPSDSDPVVYRFEELGAITVLGRNKMNIYYEDKIYQVRGDKHFNALKYVNIFHRSENIRRGDTNGKFLGL